MTPTPTAGHPADDFLRSIADLPSDSTDAYLLVDERQVVVGMNPAAEQMLGLPCQQALGSPLERFIPPRWRSEHAGLVRGFDHSPEVRRRLSAFRALTALRADGQEITVDLVVSPVTLWAAAGSREGYLARLRSPGEATDLRQELATVQRRMRAIFELAPVAIWISDHEEVVFANRAAARLFGAPDADALRGRSIYELLAHATHADVRAQMERALAGETVVTPVRGNLIRADGEVLEVEVAVAPLPDHGQTMVQMVVADITRQTRESAELERSRQALRKLSASVVEAREEERRRIARELHDELGQLLTALKLDLGRLQGQLSPPLRRQTDAMSDLLDHTIKTVRRLATELRPQILDDLGLQAGLEWLAKQSCERKGLAFELRWELADSLVNDDARSALFRICQEALNNVIRHSQATRVNIELRRDPRHLTLVVQDDGVGFSPESDLRTGLGLLGIQERIGLLGGTCIIDSEPNAGTRLVVSAPVGRCLRQH